jgi:hypothetical protein
VEMEKMMEERRKKVQEEMQQWGVRSQRSGSTASLESRLKHTAQSEPPHLARSKTRITPPSSPPLAPSASMPLPSAPPENLVINPLFDRASILSSQRSPLRPPHPVTPRGKS